MERPLSPRAQAKKKQICEAAKKLFLELGFAATSMDAVSREAGVSKQTLYGYYDGKEALLVDVLEQLIQNLGQERFFALPEPLADRTQLREALKQIAEAVVTSLMQVEYLALVRVIISESPRFPRLGQLFRTTVPEQMLKRVSSLMRQAKERGLAQFPDAESAARMFVGPLLTYVLLDGLFAPATRPQAPSSQQIEAVVDLAMKAMAVECV